MMIPQFQSALQCLKRSKDVAPEVRAFLYKTFGARCDLNSIKTPQLVLLLSRGLYDPSEIVRRDCLEAVREWMKSAPTDASDASTEEDSVFFTQLAWFSSRLEVEITESLTCTLFYAMMKMYNPGGKSFFQKFWSGTSAFSAETSLLFRMKCQYLHSSQQDLDSITPTISSYCEYVSQLFTNCVPSFIIKNLLIAACFLDFADEVGRRNMSKLIRDLLHSPVIPLRLVGPMIKVLYKIHDDISALSQIVAEIISDLQDPLASAAFDSMKYQNELQNQISTLTHLEDIRNDESIATSPWGLRAEFPLCITATIGYLQTELSLFSASTEEWARYNVLLHSLQLAEELLKYIPSGVSIKQYPAISSLLRDLFLPAVQHQMPGVRQEGVMCFGLFCLLDREAANNGFLLFTQIIQNDTTPIKITAIKLLFDMLLVFDFRGHTHVNLTGTKEGTFTRAIEILSGFIGGAELSRKQVAPESPDGKAPGTQSVALSTDRETEELLFTCVEGFAKLHLFHVLVSSEVIHKLFLELFHPRTRNWPKLRSCISGTLQEICTKSSECWEAVQRAILPCFLRIANSKDPDPFSRVPIDNVAQYLVKLVTSPSNPDQANCHTDTLVQFYRQLTLDILHEINSNPVSSGSHRLTTLLPYLDLSCHPPDFLQEILQLSTEIHSKLESGIYKTFVAQFSARIESMLNTTQNSSVPSSATSSVDPGVKALPRLSEALEQAMTPDVHRPPTKAVSDKGYQDFVLDQRKLLARIQSFELEGWDSPKKEKKEKKHRSTKQKEEEKPIRTDDVSAANGADLQQPDPQPDQASLHVRFSEGTKQEDAPTTSKPRKRKKDMEWLKQKVGILYSTPMSANTKRRRTVEQTPNEFVGVKNTTASRPTTTPLQPVIHQKNAALTPAPKTSHTVSKPPSTHVDTASATAAAHHANAEPHQVETSPPQPEAPCTTTSKIVVTCTGFTNNPQLEETLRKHVLTLGGEFIGGDTLHPRVTHVVTYSKHRTLKSVAAALCGFWIMTTSWVTDSALAGYFLPEKEFGTRYTQKPFAGKSFYLTPKFKSETPKSLVDNCTTFISLGKGVLATGECADYSLISAKSTDTGPGICFTAQQFFELIQPSSIKL
ncbi:condensin complex subunit 3 [Pelomyxa schiedti]|nr:condensin complex subunit 3 [Pelomyxa schiedti]